MTMATGITVLANIFDFKGFIEHSNLFYFALPSRRPIPDRTANMLRRPIGVPVTLAGSRPFSARY
jgi:hypothetical protein